MALAPLSLTQVFGAISIGPIVDRLAPPGPRAPPMTCMATACLFVTTMASASGVFAYAIVLGLALGSFQAINTTVYAGYFGRQHAGEVVA